MTLQKEESALCLERMVAVFRCLVRVKSGLLTIQRAVTMVQQKNLPDNRLKIDF
ncbi:hypothetical protein L0P88_21605 [Muricauda sp. SCSIO 64092]|uniref:hypothetical protein n=1 Tax=Allomuricauda sp. SCSIO 64092 TaxID=2908842 RepID=UPI001FF664F2|nr:hypothetical protein [Muricauda sp. SCSIO 64092]UOY06507.1 hypothetical protein L0P88_21605 [Muricauda sp. SCSIO 64092]